MLPGHQEAGLRAGTENVVGILGLGAAISELKDWDQRRQDILALRDLLESGILAAVPEARVNGGLDTRVCNTTSIYFPSRNAADLVERLVRGAFTSPPPRHVRRVEPSHVLQAMGFGRERANASLRFGLSRFTTVGEVKVACQTVADVFAEAPPVLKTIKVPKSMSLQPLDVLAMLAYFALIAVFGYLTRRTGADRGFSGASLSCPLRWSSPASRLPS